MIERYEIPTLGRPEPRQKNLAAKPGSLASPHASHFIPWRLAKWTRYGQWTEDGSQVLGRFGQVIYEERYAAAERRRLALKVERSRAADGIGPVPFWKGG